MNTYDTYQTLIKPEWAPPAWLFGPVWTLLYVIIAVSFGYVFWLAFASPKRPGEGGRRVSLAVAAPFALNLVFNFSYTYLQFTLQNYLLASIDILLCLATLIWAMLAIYFASPKRPGGGGSRARWVALANIPYLLWVSFATVLQLAVTYLNW